MSDDELAAAERRVRWAEQRFARAAKLVADLEQANRPVPAGLGRALLGIMERMLKASRERLRDKRRKRGLNT